ncbi:alkaline phosphatase D family protein [Pleionea sp. CnH1-48]|uniref:alkaline phosphatase D family protein n=1 Tax=Pleionea sp. CnH1-48 TaxID=2954494 RepID=UPI002097568D|nr:alkaline phosphatase D family protein [Pleionea sp. CnH1-48]MCO7224930.1 alkaline phosphatase family protein [Pleionea sp. CnH1-48]
MSNTSSLPTLLAGPILRRLTHDRVTFWLVTSVPVKLELEIHNQTQNSQAVARSDSAHNNDPISIGTSAYIYLLDYPLQTKLNPGDQLSYDFYWQEDGQEIRLSAQAPHLLYPGESAFSFVYKPNIEAILHGSCRKPHHPEGDGLVIADQRLCNTPLAERPSLLMLSGDQVYLDDVSGPMLVAIHQVIERLGLHDEPIPGVSVSDHQSLLASEHCYYSREQLLPQDKAGEAVEKGFFDSLKKPIFTSAKSHNHLITLAEVLAMYLLVWSPNLWSQVTLTKEAIKSHHHTLFDNELKSIQKFIEELPKVQRLFAHIPTYMIFDDHDVTDDWNLTRGWEETAYNHPFSRRIIGNALLGYYLCQGWGNAPENFHETLEPKVRDFFESPQQDAQDELLTQLIQFNRWHFQSETTPKLVVLDTRTHRWRSESSANQPSGLMDWEALSELQNTLLGEDAVILVSPAPIFGVKLIESIQRVFTFFGHSLMVDAENWMAHPGASNVILNIFRHPKTPQNFTILSGDVHYSFVYDVHLRLNKNSPEIWQITTSGLKNHFPKGLLRVFDRVNTWLFGSRSPLNMFTKRRRMKVQARRPSNNPETRLLNGNGVGHVEFTPEGKPHTIQVWLADGTQVDFKQRKQNFKES